MADTPTPTGPTSLIKRVPRVAWIAGGGVVVGLGYALYRDRKATSADTSPSAQPTDAPYPDGTADYGTYIGGGGVPGGVVVTGSGPPDSSAETVGAVGQTALDTIGGYFTTMVTAFEGIITGQQQAFGTSQSEIIAAIPQAQPGTSQATGAPPTQPEAQSPAQPPVAPSTPADVRATEPPTTMTNTASSVRGKSFSNMKGYSAGGVGRNAGKEYRAYRIFFKNGSSQLWNYYPDGNRWVQR